MISIVQAPHSVLSEKAKKVGKIDKNIHTLIAEMTETLIHTKDPEGIGLAAPQVNKSLQLFIIKQTKKSQVLCFINPVLIIPPGSKIQKHAVGGDSEDKKQVKLEGCLSLANIWGIVNRYPSITLSYLDEKGTRNTKEFSGFLATIIQHEYDHLQGILFPKRVLEQNEKLYKSIKNEKGETVFEEMEI